MQNIFTDKPNFEEDGRISDEAQASEGLSSGNQDASESTGMAAARESSIV